VCEGALGLAERAATAWRRRRPSWRRKRQATHKRMKNDTNSHHSHSHSLSSRANEALLAARAALLWRRHEACQWKGAAGGKALASDGRRQFGALLWQAA